VVPNIWFRCVGIEIFDTKSDHCVYYKHDGGHFLVISLYVDDMLFFGNEKDLIHDLKSQLSTQFDKDLGVAKYILGVDIRRDGENQNILLIYSKFVNSMIQHFHVADYRPLSVTISMGTKLSIE
jgi:hypothetical protein